MKVALLRTGGVAIDLAKGFVSRGHHVVFGSCNVHGEAALKALAAVPSATVALHADAAAQADIAVLATP